MSNDASQPELGAQEVEADDGAGGPLPHVWVVRAGKGGQYASDFEELGLVAIGFAEISSVEGLDRDEIFDRAKTALGSKGGNVGGQIYRFADAMEVGDLVVVPDGGTRELLYGRVKGPYEHPTEAPLEGFRHVRKVEWLGRRNRDELPDRILFSLGSLLTVFEPAEQSHLARYLLTGEDPSALTPDTNGSDDSGDSSSAPSAGEQGARNKELIGKKIAALGWSETQDLVADVLRAMDYTAEVAKAGADGGIDVLACRDPLFLHPPVIKVQVKARPDTKISAEEIRQLSGIVDRGSERGIFVATGGFTKNATTEAAQMGIKLWDLEDLVDVFLDTYRSLGDRSQDLIPLTQIWVLEDPDESDSGSDRIG